MKKIFILLLSLVIPFITNAQNYQCLQYGPIRYFTNAQGYVRGIRIDSVRTIGTDIVYYPYHTLRMQYACRNLILDSDGGSWIGKNVIQQSDGTFLFDNMWHDTVVIKTQAGIGASWTLFDDTTLISYKATVTGIDTMTLWGVLDTVKTITIEADSNGIMYPLDPVNGFQIKLGKNSGFAQAIDLFTFPYHEPDSVNVNNMFYDFYLDRLTGSIETADVTCYFENHSRVNAQNSLFKALDLYNPMQKEIYNYNVGDELQTEYRHDDYFSYGYYHQLTYAKVLTKTITPPTVNYTFAVHQNTQTFHASGMTLIYDTTNVYDTVYGSADTSRLLDLTKLPEETGTEYFLHYFPNTNPVTNLADSSYCSTNIYEIDGEVRSLTSVPDYGNSVLDPVNTSYGLGFGKVGSYRANSFIGYTETLRLIYSNKGGNVCGGLRTDMIENIKKTESVIAVTPNPTHGQLVISSDEMIRSISVHNIVGQEVFSVNCDSKEMPVDLTSLPPGLYLIRINGLETRKIIRE